MDIYGTEFYGYSERFWIFLFEIARGVALRHDDETEQRERKAGILILTVALYESKIKDTEIVRLIQK